MTAKEEPSDARFAASTGRLRFGVTWDYRCPFARNAHEHLVAALRDGADYDVSFVPFSLGETHVPEGGTSVFEDPSKRQDLMATEVGLVVRDRFPGRFLEAHVALFTQRHDEGRDLRDEKELRLTLSRLDIDADLVFEEISSGRSLEIFRTEHQAAERAHSVWGVPTFIVGERAAFVRIMSRPEGDPKVARQTVEHVVALFSELPALNEFKHTTVPN